MLSCQPISSFEAIILLLVIWRQQFFYDRSRSDGFGLYCQSLGGCALQQKPPCGSRPRSQRATPWCGEVSKKGRSRKMDWQTNKAESPTVGVTAPACIDCEANQKSGHL